MRRGSARSNGCWERPSLYVSVDRGAPSIAGDLANISKCYQLHCNALQPCVNKHGGTLQAQFYVFTPTGEVSTPIGVQRV